MDGKLTPVVGSQFLDLDDVSPPAKTVKIKGKEYYISADESVAENIKFLQKLKVLDPGDPESAQEMLKEISKFFLPYDETMTAEKIGELVGVSQLPFLAKFVFTQVSEVSEDELKKKESETLETIK